jgi:hypothetical protein
LFPSQSVADYDKLRGDLFSVSLIQVAIEQLRDAGAFDSVLTEGAVGSKAEYQIELLDLHWCGDTFPSWWTVLSLGFIPHVEDWCSGMRLRISRDGSSAHVEIDSMYKGKAIHGWGAVMMATGPDRIWGGGPPEQKGHPRFAQHLALAIALRKQQIGKCSDFCVQGGLGILN